MAKSDPVGDKYYVPLRWAERASDTLFWVGGVASVSALLISRADYPLLSDLAQIILVVAVIFYFGIGLSQRLYLAPRAEEKRRQDLLSNSFEVNLTHEVTEGYYNNQQKHPLKRLAASTMESCFFTEAVLAEMLWAERAKFGGWFAIWLLAALNRSTDLSPVSVAAQVLFSEEIVSKWIRTEWLRFQSARTYENLRRLLTNATAFNKRVTQAETVEFFSNYEAAKARAQVHTSDRVFSRRNAELSAEWERIKASIGLL